MSVCPDCSAIATRHGLRARRVQDVGASGAQTSSDIPVQRWRCTRCHGCYMELPPGSRSRSVATIALRDATAEACFEAGYSGAAARFEIDEKTARGRFAEWAGTRERDLPICSPRWVGLHQVTACTKTATVVTDVEARTVVDILPGDGVHDVAAWLDRTGDTGGIDNVAVDLHGPYRDAVRQHAPWAKIMVCPEHARRQGMGAFLSSFRSACREVGRAPESNVRERAGVFATPRKKLTSSYADDMRAWDDAVIALYDAKERFMDALSEGCAEDAQHHLAAARADCQFLGARQPVALMDAWSSEMAAGVGKPELTPFGELLAGLAAVWARRRPPLPFDIARGLMILRDGQQAVGSHPVAGRGVPMSAHMRPNSLQMEKAWSPSDFPRVEPLPGGER